jgi:hypothetical protein
MSASIIVLAKVTFSDKLPPPKKEPAFPKEFYPMFKVRTDGIYNCGMIQLIDVPSSKPGETVTAKINFLTNGELKAWIYPGKEFSFYHGKLLLGEGEILTIVTEQ